MAWKAEINSRLVRQKSTEEYSQLFLALPVARNQITSFGSRKISPAHVGQLNNSIDFIVPKGTEIFAAAEGVVLAVKDDSKVGGSNPKHWNDGNFIEIKHDNGESTWYEHLMHRGVVVKPRERVRQGQLIGYTGNTGFTDRPHLHFELRKYYGVGPDDYVTMKARFKGFQDIYETL